MELAINVIFKNVCKSTESLTFQTILPWKRNTFFLRLNFLHTGVEQSNLDCLVIKDSNKFTFCVRAKKTIKAERRNVYKGFYKFNKDGKYCKSVF